MIKGVQPDFIPCVVVLLINKCYKSSTKTTQPNLTRSKFHNNLHKDNLYRIRYLPER